MDGNNDVLGYATGGDGTNPLHPAGSRCRFDATALVNTLTWWAKGV
jgi:hypothetical protein